MIRWDMIKDVLGAVITGVIIMLLGAVVFLVLSPWWWIR